MDGTRADEAVRVACADETKADEVRAACARVVSGLPEALRETMRRDAEALATMMLRLCPDAPWLTVQVEVVAVLGACKRWHQDRYTARALITYTGPGTWCVDDSSVCYDQFAATVNAPVEVSDTRIVPRSKKIHRPEPNAVVIVKGNSWPGIQGVGLTHKSPDVRTDARGRPELKRLVLKVDLAEWRPGL